MIVLQPLLQHIRTTQHSGLFNGSTFMKYPKGMQAVLVPVPVQEEALMWNKILSYGWLTVVITCNYGYCV